MKCIQSAALAAATLTLSSPVLAQGGPPKGWLVPVDVLAAWQGDANFSGGGSFNVKRAYARLGAIHFMDNGFSYGFQGTLGRTDYGFSGTAAPWRDLNDNSFSVSLGYAAANGMRFFVAPTLRSNYADGARASDGQTYGVFGGISWQVRDNLRIGPAFGVYSSLGSESTNFFPALLIDWDITDRLSLGTGRAVGASEGPGLSLNYDLGNSFSIGVAGRYEKSRFKLGPDSSVPNGVGEDRAFPLVATLAYSPNPGVSMAAFAGAELNGRLRVENAAGTVVSDQTYDAAPIAGFSFTLTF